MILGPWRINIEKSLKKFSWFYLIRSLEKQRNRGAKSKDLGTWESIKSRKREFSQKIQGMWGKD